MTYRIKKGKHRAWPWMIGLWYGKTAIPKKVRFDITAKYDLGYPDQEDTNKLFGIGFTQWWRLVWIFFSYPFFVLLNKERHHWDSARFGWRWTDYTNGIMISAYCYVNGNRVIRDIVLLKPNHNYLFELLISADGYDFIITDWDSGFQYGKENVFKNKTHRWSFPLGLYFGGNRKAPHDIKIKMQKI